MIARLRRVLGSGWIPAVLVFVVAAVVLRDSARVGFADIGLFTLWCLWGFTVPGVVLWRRLDWHRDHRPFLEDVVLGTILGIVVALPVYLALVWLGHPHAVVAWPLLVLVPAAATRSGRALVRRRQATPTPAWFSWGLALVLLFAVLRLHHLSWAAGAITDVSLRTPYVDEPYHLSLVSEFRYHFPAQVPYVAGTPLRYHWLVYPFLAASSWGSGVSPIVLLRLLGPTALVTLTILGVAVAAHRIGGHRWSGVLGAALVCVVTPLDLMGWTGVASPGQSFAWAPFRSPTQVFADTICPLVVVLVVGVLRGGARRWWHWVAAFVVMLAAAGAKSAMVPLFVGGLCGTVVVLLVVRRRIEWRVAGLAAMSAVVFELATKLFYGSGSRALTLHPFQIVDKQAVRRGLVALGQTPSTFLQISLTIVFVVSLLAPLAGGLGLFVRGGWRRPLPWLLTGCFACALVIVLAFHHPGLGQYYFLESSLVPAALLAALGWSRLVGPMTPRVAAAIAGTVLVGTGLGFLVPAVTSHVRPASQTGSDVHKVLVLYAVPMGTGIVVAALLGLAWLVLAKRREPSRGHGLLVTVAVLFGMCLPFALSQVVDVGRAPLRTRGDPTIPAGGFKAALWLSAHTSPDTLIATNAHTLPQHPRDYRAFWISAYAERRVLVEGWAYVPPESVGLPSNAETNRAAGGPFWDLPLLRLNDAVFEHPTAANIAELHRRYGVEWLFAGRGRGADLNGLARLTTQRLSNPSCVIYQIRG